MKIRYLSWLRDRLGVDTETVALPPEVRTVADLMAWLRARGDAFELAFGRPGAIKAGIGGRLAPPTTSLDGASEVLLMPTLAGG